MFAPLWAHSVQERGEARRAIVTTPFRAPATAKPSTVHHQTRLLPAFTPVRWGFFPASGSDVIVNHRARDLFLMLPRDLQGLHRPGSPSTLISKQMTTPMP